MAGGKLSPRQKMVNLMYLVFIAMMALNMSKEVLSAFGLLNEKFEDINTASLVANQGAFNDLQSKGSEDAGNFKEAADKAKLIKAETDKMFAFIAGMKAEVEKGFEKDKETQKYNYETMDKGDNIDSWFKGDGYSDRGTEIVAQIDAYRNNIIKVLGTDKKYEVLVKEINSKFNTGKVKGQDKVERNYLDHHFKGYPAIASLTKLTAMQNDVKKVEQDAYNLFLGKSLAQAASYSNYQAIIIPEKSAFFSGEKFAGKVALGRYDDSTIPTKVVIDGRELNLSESIENGQVKLDFMTKGVGEHDITGEFTFMEDGKPINIPIKGNYVVVPKPNSATISADKMNVVYRGVVNPMTISFAGVSADQVNASGPGLTKGSKPGQYNMSPGQGTEALITVTGTLPDGSKVSDKKVFRIKGIPGPLGAIAGETGSLKGSKSRLENAQITAKLPDFDFDVNLRVTQFTFKAPGQAAVIVNGNQINQQCRAALARAGRGDVITISDIKTELVGSTILLPRTAPVMYEIQ